MASLNSILTTFLAVSLLLQFVLSLHRRKASCRLEHVLASSRYELRSHSSHISFKASLAMTDRISLATVQHRNKNRATVCSEYCGIQNVAMHLAASVRSIALLRNGVGLILGVCCGYGHEVRLVTAFQIQRSRMQALSYRCGLRVKFWQRDLEINMSHAEPIALSS